MEIKNLVGIGKKWLWLFVLAAILGGAAGLGMGLLQPRQYQAEATLFISTPNRSDYMGVLGDQQAAKAYAQFPKSVTVLSSTMQTFGIKESLDDFVKRISVDNLRETQYVNVRVKDNDPQRAADIANEMAQQAIALAQRNEATNVQQRQFLRDEAKKIEEQLKALDRELQLLTNSNQAASERAGQINQQLVTLRSSYGSVIGALSQINGAELKFFQRAEAPIKPLGSGPTILIIIGALVGMIAAVGLVAFIEQTDDVLRTPTKVAEASGLPTYATVKRLPVARQALALAAPGGGSADGEMPDVAPADLEIPEVFLRLGAFFQSKDTLSPDGSKLGTLLITSPENGDGKTLNASQIALGMARLGSSVVLIDANLRDPGVHNVFGVPNNKGLSNLLAEPKTLKFNDVLVPTRESSLNIITAGTASGIQSEFLSSMAMTELLKSLSENSLVIIDSPAVLSSSDPVILAGKTDGILLVVDARYTSAGKLNQTIGSLNRVNPNILGVVLNRATSDD